MRFYVGVCTMLINNEGQLTKINNPLKTKTIMANWTQQQLDAAWAKTKPAKGFSDNKHRLDIYGALIYQDSRDDSDMAWEVNHIFPKAILEYFNIDEATINDERNLQALHHSNNSSKGNNFALHKSKIVYDEQQKKNIEKEQSWSVSSDTYPNVRELYEPLLGMTLEEAEEKYNKEVKKK